MKTKKGHNKNSNSESEKKKSSLDSPSDIHRILEEVSGLDVKLSAHEDYNRLLKDSLIQARRVTAADAGSLYLNYGDFLLFEVFQNDTLEKEGRLADFAAHARLRIPLDNNSLAGHCALQKKVLVIDDVKKNGSFNQELDRALRYETRTMISVPLLDETEQLVGVMQLINALDQSGSPIPFKKADLDRIEPLSRTIAAAIGRLKDLHG